MTSDNPRRRSGLAFLFDRVDCDLLVYFRIVFSIVALFWVVKQLTSGAVDQLYAEPRFHFHYFGFHWVELLPGKWNHLEFGLIGFAAVLMGLGACYRISALTFAVGFTHLFLGDKCLYQNHYYLICLLAWIMVFVPANCSWSVDARIRPERETQTVPRWAIWLLRFQIGVPYFFGGIAKLSPDWLAGEPMRQMLAQRTDLPFVGQYFEQELCVYLMAYGATAFDLLVVPALLTKRFRLVACAIAIVFHALNAWLFTIGVFPWLMLLALPIYFPSGSLRKTLFRMAPDLQLVTPSEQENTVSHRIALLFGVFVIWQSLFPLRHHVLTSNPNWTEEAHCFSWHMLLRGKQCALRYTARDPQTGREGAIDLRRYVTPFQLNRVSREPRLIHQLAQYIGSDLRSRGFKEVELRALCLASMNGRKPQLLVDPEVDLLLETQPWSEPDWTETLTEPLRLPHWDAPISEWEVLK